MPRSECSNSGRMLPKWWCGDGGDGSVRSQLCLRERGRQESPACIICLAASTIRVELILVCTYYISTSNTVWLTPDWR